jgi:uncharacterized protein with HEPN domain
MSRKRELRVADYLQHILDAIERIEGYLASGDEQSFMQSFMAQDAVIRNLEVIGEAAINVRSLDPAAAAQYPAWDQICGMRNRLTHGYFDINLEVVWRTTQNDLPALRQHIKSMLKS